MWFFRVYKRSEKDALKLKAYEDQIEQLCDVIARLRQELDHVRIQKERSKIRCQDRRDRIENLKPFIEYQNFHNIPGHLWPKITCYQCNNSRTKKQGYFCKLHRFTCGKYGSCKHSAPKKVSLEEYFEKKKI